MLHTKFRENRPAGSGEEDFWRVFTIYGPGGHLGHVTQMPRTNFRSPYPRRLHIKFDIDQASGFGEEDVWNCLRRTMTDADGRTPDHEYPISSPMSLWLRWAKNHMNFYQFFIKYSIHHTLSADTSFKFLAIILFEIRHLQNFIPLFVKGP